MHLVFIKTRVSGSISEEDHGRCHAYRGLDYELTQLVRVDGLFDAQQDGGHPGVQGGHGVVLVHDLRCV